MTANNLLMQRGRAATVMALTYLQTSKISRNEIINKIVDYSDAVGVSPVGAAPTTSSFLDLTPGSNGLGRDNCTETRKFKYWDLVRLIPEVSHDIPATASEGLDQ